MTLGLRPLGSLVGNMVPLAGVLFLGWDLPSVVVMYWIEAGVVGVVSALRIRMSLSLGPPTTSDDGAIQRQIVRRDASPAPPATGGWLLPLLWLLAYGVFWVILGPFVIQIANGGFYVGASATGWTGASGTVIAWGTAALVGGQLVSFIVGDVIERRYLTATSLELLRDPFVRILVIIATIATGGIGIALIGSPIGFLVAMVVAKTAVELWFLRAAPAGTPAG